MEVGVDLPERDVDLELAPSVSGGLADPTDLAVDRGTGDVIGITAASRKRARVDADDVRLPRREGKQLWPAATDQDRRVRPLDRGRQAPWWIAG